MKLTKRGFLQTLFGGSILSLPQVGKIEVLKLEAKDTIVVHYSGHMSYDTMEHLREDLKRHWPNNEVLILTEGLQLKVLKG